MRLRTTFWFLLFVIVAMTNKAVAQQPYGGCWHPEDVLNWSPETDPDAPFNRGVVPLAPRFKEEQLIKANQYQYYEGQVCNSTIMFHQCSQAPAQGANTFTMYNPTYWQYMDLLVWWAGSAGEGIIIPPTGPCIDAAHMNGVRILGQLFFPPSSFGGISKWAQEMLETKDPDGRRTYARKLYEIAAYFGFDGWFINEEIYYGDESQWAEWIKDFQYFADKGGNPGMEIQWYRARQQYNSAIMQSHVNTSMFLEYGSPYSCTSQMSGLQAEGFTREQAFKKLYFGVQCVHSNNDIGMDLETLYGKNGHNGSIDLFCPEERIWKDQVKDLLGGPNETGEQAYKAMKTVFEKEEEFWVNSAGDPSVTTNFGSYGDGMSGHILERSVISYKPFVSTFSVGMGKYRFVNGEQRNQQDWSHRGMQTIMPTWRWWVESADGNTGDEMEFSINWDYAYNMGSSVKAYIGNFQAGDEHLVRLYKTQIAVEAGDKLQLVYYARDARHKNAIEVKLGTKEDNNAINTTLTAKTTRDNNGWTIDEYDLSSLSGKTVSIIALNFKTDEQLINYTVYLGQIGVYPAGYTANAPAATNLATTSKLTEDGGDLRLTWDIADRTDISHFNVYLNAGNGRKLVGQTRNTAFYIPKFQRESASAPSVTVEVVSVARDMSETATASLDVKYPELSLPEVTLVASKTLVEVGDEVTITAKATGFPTDWAWHLPEGMTELELSADKQTIKVKCEQAGMMNVRIDVTNAKGTTKYEEKLVEVVESTAGILKNVSVGKTIHSYSGSTNSSEVPDNLIDGVTETYNMSDKWCNINTEHWAIIDLEGFYNIYQFKAYDCQVNESGDNYPDYKISLSKDLKEWTTVVDVTGNLESIKEDWIKPTEARYVKFEPGKDGMMTIRIWEFEVYGKEVPQNLRITVPEQVKVKSGATGMFDVVYKFNGDERGDDFKCEVTSGDTQCAAVKQIREDAEAGKFTVELEAGKIIAQTELLVRVHNNGKYQEAKVTATADSDDAKNVVAGAAATVTTVDGTQERYDNVMTLTDGNTTENGFPDDMPSFGEYDRSVIFTPASGVWNVAKVGVFLPEEHNVLSMRIATSEDGTSWKELAVVDGLQERSGEITHYFSPTMLNCSNLKFDFNVDPGMTIRVAEIEIYEQFEEALPLLVPMTVSQGFNRDAIVEARPTRRHASTGIDAMNYTVYTTGVQEAGALPLNEERTLLSAKSGVPFTLAAYDSYSNAAQLKGYSTNATLRFDIPHRAKKLYFLAAADGESAVTVTVNYTDRTNTKTEGITVPDWASMASGASVANIGCIQYQTSPSMDNQEDLIESGFGLYEFTVEADVNKIIESVDIRKTDGDAVTFFAVTKEGIHEAPSVKLNLPRDVNMRIGKVQQAELTYEFLTQKESNFYLSIDPVDRSVISLGNENRDEDGRLTFDITGVGVGESGVAVELRNGTTVIKDTFNVVVADLERESIADMDDISMKVGEARDMRVKYSLGDMQRAEDFDMQVQSYPNNVRVTKVSFDDEAVSFTLNADRLGESTITVFLINGASGAMISKDFKVNVVEEKPETIDRPENQTIKVGESVQLSAAYSLGDMTKEDNFAIAATADNANVTIADAVVGETTFDFTVKGEAKGTSVVTLTLTNGENTRTAAFTVTVQQPETMDEPEDQRLEYGTTTPMTVAYSLGDMQEADNFGITVVSDKTDIVEVLDVQVGNEAVTFNLKAWKAGDAAVTLTLTNGETVIEHVFGVTVFQVVEESLEQVDNQTVEVGHSVQVTAEYSLGTMEQADNFAITATVDDETKAQIVNLEVGDADVTFDLEGLAAGNTKGKLTLVNGQKKIEREFFITVIGGNALGYVDAAAASVWPNPVNTASVLNVSTPEATGKVCLVSLQGVLIKEQPVTDTLTQISLDHVQPGTYFVHIGGTNVSVAKVIVK